ncbi:hypothetical protein CU097_004326 [Rhizopus azygosporus]|uniref:Uncharacterized protein n=1 Tax=Rhizopus azygosporus TaxID=86630 RepID=A0A367K042_RHIAZ|nr:hypothetical protein CU097_004326 [Rhizopus azygosporus]
MVIYKTILKIWKEQGCIVIGYARKSDIPLVKDDVRVKNIQSMIDILRERSGADEVYVSSCTNSTEPIASRDINVNQDMISSLHQCSGDAQGK